MTPSEHVRLEEYRPLVGDEIVDRIRDKARPLRGIRIAHMNSTYFAGGVVEILLSLSELQTQLGIRTDWRLLRGSPDFFEVTREMHDAMQAGAMELTDDKLRTYERVIAGDASRNILDHDVVYMHDHHTMGMVSHFEKNGRWIWRCHLDLTAPHPDLIHYLSKYAEQYDAVVCILDEYKQDAFTVPQYSILPAIDPFRQKNQTFDRATVLERLEMHGIPTDRPIVTQISRFDQWKDPHGVVDAFELASQDVDATLVMVGNRPSDDPEENELLDRLLERRSNRVLVLDGTDQLLVAALQQHATVVLQKSIREGFGLTVSEALWKGTPVIGGNVGGIPQQIDHGLTGYLVDSPEEAAQWIVELVSDPDKAAEMGERGRKTVRNKFLMTRLFENHLDMLHELDAGSPGSRASR